MSSLGRVKSLGRSVDFGCKGIRITKDRILSPALSSMGYPSVILCVDQKKKNCSVHRLVAETFLREPNGKVVNHIDGDKTNNVVSNLEWVTQKENVAHSIKNGLRNAPKGEKHWSAVLTTEKVRQVKELITEGFKRREIAAKTGVAAHNVAAIKSRRAWRHVK